MKKILITGKNGQLGWELQKSLCSLGEVVSLDRKELDLSQPGLLAKKIREESPGVIVNAAAYTDVEKAEDEPEIAMMVNGIAPGILAAEAKRLGALLIHFSTDYVFDGQSEAAYKEDAPVNPINIYGKSKLEGERAIQEVQGNYLILRTSWVYSARNKNFLISMLKLAKENRELKVVADQFGVPNWSETIALNTREILRQCLNGNKELWGLYHLSASGSCSRFEWAQEIFKQSAELGLVSRIPIVKPISSLELTTKAVRPKFSVLSPEKASRYFHLEQHDWKVYLKRYFERVQLNVRG